MSSIKWRKEFSVEIKELDKQHKKIIKILNRMIALDKKGKNEKEIGKILDNLHEYIKEHFRTEEGYMLAHNYSGYDKQKQEHNRFIDRLCEFQKEYLKGHGLTTINLFNFVWDWFSQHIIKLDKQYSPFLKEKI
ncbi:bacteriohemerythrin [Thermodesulfobacteriota bacterium]